MLRAVINRFAVSVARTVYKQGTIQKVQPLGKLILKYYKNS